MKNKKERIAVIGAGHAGVEAALAISRMGEMCYLITKGSNTIGRMSCNPAIGGLAKGHLVREIDALGGIMGYAADCNALQFKTLNKSKGRAVWSPRAQVDKVKYSNFITKTISDQKNITIISDEVVDICVDKHAVSGLVLKDKSILRVSCVIICTGTFLTGKIHIGRKNYPAGRFAETQTVGITQSLVSMGFETTRLKTGTPPRLLSSSINWDQLLVASGDVDVNYFSILTDNSKTPPNIDCHIAKTNKNTHDIIKRNINHSPMFSGEINAIGPRYCPSIEDKMVRFSDRDSHQLFLEPEWQNSKQIYINGFSTSLPQNIQKKALRSIKGLENVELIRPGYAIEYDYFPSRQLKSTLETKNISGLFLAGQLNGTSGYEEAAAQGLLAGVNASHYINKTQPLILKRENSYIGVLIDDLITKNINEPYRMFTSRAEHRLYLRQDNADIRLTNIGLKHNLISNDHLYRFNKFYKEYKKTKNLLLENKTTIGNKKISLWDALKKDKTTYTKEINLISKKTSKNIFFAIESESKYEGYINIQSSRVKKIKKLENSFIPQNINYNNIKNLSSESLEKLSMVKPETLGQAARIDGVRQSDIAVLSFYIGKISRNVSRETNK